MAKYRITRYAIDDGGVRTEEIDDVYPQVVGSMIEFFRGSEAVLYIPASDVIEIRRIEEGQ